MTAEDAEPTKIFRLIRWILSVAAVLLLTLTGLSLYSRPDYEVAYYASEAFRQCPKVECIIQYNLEVGNTGRKEQSAVDVEVETKWLTHALLPLSVRNFGKVDRLFTTNELEGGVTVIHLGRLESDKRVELGVTLRLPDSATSIRPEEIFRKVTSSNGVVRNAPPAQLSWGRLLYSVFHLW